MKREIRITGDGSHTVYVPELNEPYHSIHGAIQESMHVFIKQGFRRIGNQSIRILETGMGTGLNVLLTLSEALKEDRKIHYHAVEKYPLEHDEYRSLNYEKIIHGLPRGTMKKLHEAPWSEEIELAPGFSLFKEKTDFRTMDPPGLFNLVYFDAFAPEKQPHLWSEEILSRLFSLTTADGILVTYTSKGIVRRRLQACGFNAERVPGPPGKREMLRATRI